MRRALAIVLLGAASLALAEAPARHVYVGGLTDGELALALGTTEESMPPFIVNGDEVLPMPSPAAPQGDETTLAASGTPSADAIPRMRPDRLTGTTTATDYFEAFTPAIAPHKRTLAYDAVALDGDGTPVLTVASPEPATLALDREELHGPRDAFWGNVVVDFARGSRVPLPSIAPDARTLHLRTEPSVATHLARDSAGNAYVVADAPGLGSVRIVFLTDVARGFFARPLPSQRFDALASHVPTVPPSIAERGKTFARELGIEPGSDVAVALPRLVAHFRAFSEGAPPESESGDIYLDLARGGVGVCRHRAYAFFVTAVSLGMPARYVQNEAHAWVEVELRDGFLRIDLGGGTQQIDAHGLLDRPRHEVAAADPFPRPPAFVEGLARSAIERAAGAEDGAGGAGQQGPNGREVPAPGTDSAADDADHAGDPAATDGTPPSLTETILVLDEPNVRAYRGQVVDLRGRVEDARSRPVVEGRVEVRVGDSPLLGAALTDESGRFALSIAIPPSLGVGRHDLRVRFVGADGLAPAQAQ